MSKNSVITLKYAMEQQMVWYKAMEAVASGQEYKIGTRMLSMPHLQEIRAQVKYWEDKTANLRRGRRGRRTFSIVPVDM